MSRKYMNMKGVKKIYEHEGCQEKKTLTVLRDKRQWLHCESLDNAAAGQQQERTINE